MNWGMRLLSASRPLVFLVVIGAHLADRDLGMPIVALLSVSAVFLAVSSAIIVGWIPSLARWCQPLIWTEMGLVAILVAVFPAGAMTTILSPVAITLFLVLPRSQWLAASLTFGAIFLIPVFLTQESTLDSWFSGLAYVSLIMFSCGAALMLRNLEEQRARSERLLGKVQESEAALQRALQQLRETADLQQQAAVLEERQRMAREIHDSVAHSLTALFVQLQAGRRLLERSSSPAAETLAGCEEMAREALRETRRAVRALRPSGLAGREHEVLQRLGREFGAATGMQVSVTASDAASALPPDPVRLEQLYRIFQEALTNAYRHGRAQQVQATLEAAGGSLIFTVHNDGTPPRTLGPGVGLESMQERVRSLDGTIQFEPGERGLTVRVTVPAPVDAQEEDVS